MALILVRPICQPVSRVLDVADQSSPLLWSLASNRLQTFSLLWGCSRPCMVEWTIMLCHRSMACSTYWSFGVTICLVMLGAFALSTANSQFTRSNARYLAAVSPLWCAFPAIHTKINLVSIAAKSAQPMFAFSTTRKQANRTQCSGTPPARTPYTWTLACLTMHVSGPKHPLHMYAHNAELLCKFQVTLGLKEKKILLAPMDGDFYVQPSICCLGFPGRQTQLSQDSPSAAPPCSADSTSGTPAFH
ncbi:hypothetical protein HDV63DRAFT_28246 [Trichoderma sp. SZMC 28014]